MISLDPKGDRDLVITDSFIRYGLCHQDRWEVFFEHVVSKYKNTVWVHWPTIYPWIKTMALRGDDNWLARNFLDLWEKDIIRAIPADCGTDELPSIVAFRDLYNHNFRVIVGTVDEWLQLRQDFDKEDLAY